MVFSKHSMVPVVSAFQPGSMLKALCMLCLSGTVQSDADVNMINYGMGIATAQHSKDAYDPQVDDYDYKIAEAVVECTYTGYSHYLVGHTIDNIVWSLGNKTYNELLDWYMGSAASENVSDVNADELAASLTWVRTSTQLAGHEPGHVVDLDHVKIADFGTTVINTIAGADHAGFPKWNSLTKTLADDLSDILAGFGTCEDGTESLSTDPQTNDFLASGTVCKNPDSGSLNLANGDIGYHVKCTRPQMPPQEVICKNTAGNNMNEAIPGKETFAACQDVGSGNAYAEFTAGAAKRLLVGACIRNVAARWAAQAVDFDMDGEVDDFDGTIGSCDQSENDKTLNVIMGDYDLEIAGNSTESMYT